MAAPPLTILIDGECPLCRREGEFMRRLDGGRGRLRFVDITAPGFDAAAYGTTHDAAMGTIHALTPDGGVVTGMEVFRRAYAAVGWGWLVAPTGWPLVRPVVDRMYRWFARNRLRLTGRRAEGCGERCEAGRCAPER